jgi:hypothetical protein
VVLKRISIRLATDCSTYDGCRFADVDERALPSWVERPLSICRVGGVSGADCDNQINIIQLGRELAGEGPVGCGGVM